MDDDSIPTGEIRRCRGAMDLSAPAAVGARLSEADQGMGGGRRGSLGGDALQPSFAEMWQRVGTQATTTTSCCGSPAPRTV